MDVVYFVKVHRLTPSMNSGVLFQGLILSLLCLIILKKYFQTEYRKVSKFMGEIVKTNTQYKVSIKHYQSD